MSPRRKSLFALNELELVAILVELVTMLVQNKTIYKISQMEE